MEDLSIESLAQIACLAPSHFITSFRKQYGVTPMSYRANARYTEATRLLLETDLSVGDIRESVGIEGTSTFTRDFRLRYGASPTEFRNLRTSRSSKPGAS